MILRTRSAVQSQVEMFLRCWQLPDCGSEDNLEVLKKLKKKCEIKDGNISNCNYHACINTHIPLLYCC